MKFKSNLLAGFGAGFVTPVNTINFATVFDNLGEKLIENVAVWTTILAFIIIYIPFAVLARYLDKKDAFKVIVLSVVDILLLYALNSNVVANRLSTTTAWLYCISSLWTIWAPVSVTIPWCPG